MAQKLIQERVGGPPPPNFQGGPPAPPNPGMMGGPPRPPMGQGPPNMQPGSMIYPQDGSNNNNGPPMYM